MFLRRFAATLKPVAKIRFFSSYNGHDFTKEIAELNQEMEFVFGEPPASSGPAAPPDSQKMAEESHLITQEAPHKEEPFSGSTHIGSKGEAQMVDITSKGITDRVAVASCKVILGQKVFDLVSANQMEKGDVLGVAKIAGVYGAKHTSNLIPLCHNINLSHVHLDLTLNPRDLSVEIQGQAMTTWKTGVEMEALTAVAGSSCWPYSLRYVQSCFERYCHYRHKA